MSGKCMLRTRRLSGRKGATDASFLANPGRPLTIPCDAAAPSASHASFRASDSDTPLPKPPKSL